ncbi:hypothetical protein [Syntrophorhabdus aromaticivorans]|uniref:Uncharacterized protein n=1 Tax=Syntrophorhabdus aromaticivorans TaxID=328301 RepID=A0A971S096_9BACT|nr:hypothetical protein [Syntrophorhabdus aromaticivorans]NLW34846.1 hypothetical protein [Syntrophorhabdus aromaticivorans]
MDYRLNSTKSYHVYELGTLGWELTVCNALYPPQTPIRKILLHDDSYGHFLYDYLSRLVPMADIRKVLEIGGGYGYLMKDFLDRNSSLRPCMLDISPFLLQRQKETLEGHDIFYREEDFLETDPAVLTGFDLAVLNENLGDFPTLVNLSEEFFEPPAQVIDPNLKRALDLFERYNFERPAQGLFNFNIGAIEALEKICASGVPYVYLGEHSCEAAVPGHLQSMIHVDSKGSPERISLKGHDEYTIKMSYLEKIAHTFHYTSVRGPFADFIPVDFTDRLRFILASQGRYGDEDEMICQFVEDLYKYEYLVLAKQ